MREEHVEVASREAAFAAMRARGIVPMTVRVGATKPRNARNTRNATGKMAAVAIILALLGGVAWWLGRGSGTSSMPAETRKQVSPAAPSEVMTHVTESNATSVAKAKSRAAAKEVHLASTNIVTESFTTNRSGTIVRRWRTADGKTHVLFMDPPPLVEEMTGSDQAIALAINTAGDVGGGAPMPSIPNLEAQFRESLKHPITMSPDDTPEVKRAKEEIMANRAAVKALLDQGMSLEEILSEHRALSQENRELRMKVQSELDEIYKKGDMEGARKYRDAMSEALQGMGIDGLEMPMSAEERAKLRALRRAARRTESAAAQKGFQRDNKEKKQ